MLVDEDRAPLGPPPATEEDAHRLLRDLWWLGAGPVVIGVLYGIWVRLVGDSAVASVVADGAVACLALSGAIMNRRLVRRALRFPGARGWGATLLVALVAAPTVMLLFSLLETLGFRFSGGYLGPYVDDGWPPWVGFVSVAVVTPLSEETLFRGLIQPKLEQFVRPTEALIVQAALFSAAHLSMVILVTHFLMGLSFGWVRRRTQSLLPGILLHGAWNAWVVAHSG